MSYITKTLVPAPFDIELRVHSSAGHGSVVVDTEQSYRCSESNPNGCPVHRWARFEWVATPRPDRWWRKRERSVFAAVRAAVAWRAQRIMEAEQVEEIARSAEDMANSIAKVALLMPEIV